MRRSLAHFLAALGLLLTLASAQGASAYAAPAAPAAARGLPDIRRIVVGDSVEWHAAQRAEAARAHLAATPAINESLRDRMAWEASAATAAPSYADKASIAHDVRDAIRQLRPGQVAHAGDDDGRFKVAQLVVTPSAIVQFAKVHAAASPGTPTLPSALHILFLGDSTTTGVGAGSGGSGNVNGSRPFSSPIQAANYLIAAGFPVATDTINADNNNGFSQTAWTGYRPEITLATATGLNSGSSGGNTIGGAQGVLTATQHSLTFVTAVAGDTVELWGNIVSGTGSLTVAVDGGAPTTIDMHTGFPVLKQLTSITGLANTTHSIVFDRSGGNAYFPVSVAVTDSTKKQWVIFNAGARNWTIEDWQGTGFPNMPLTAVQTQAAYYDGLAINLGINNQRQVAGTYDKAVEQAHIQTIVDAYFTGNPSGKVVFITPNPISAGDTPTGSWSNAEMTAMYSNLQTIYAASKPGQTAWVNTGALVLAAFGSNSYSGLQSAGYINADGLHPTVGVAGDGGIYRVQGYGAAAAFRTLFNLNVFVFPFAARRRRAANDNARPARKAA